MSPHLTRVTPNYTPKFDKNKYILLRDDRLKTIYKHKIFLKSKRQPPNLKKLLNKARFSNKGQQKFQVTKFKEPRCGCKNFTVNADISRTVKKVIYVIECRGCLNYKHQLISLLLPCMKK